MTESGCARVQRGAAPLARCKVPGVTARTTGWTAGSRDFNDAMKAHAPLVFAFVLGLAFVLLLLTFRSIVIPLRRRRDGLGSRCSCS